MQNNMSSLDVAVRWVIALALIIVAGAFSAQPLISLVAALGALIMAATALTKKCPLYELFGFSTCAPRRN